MKEDKNNHHQEQPETMPDTADTKQMQVLLKTAVGMSAATILIVLLCYAVYVVLVGVYPVVADKEHDIYFMYATMDRVLRLIVALLASLLVGHIKLIFDIKKLEKKRRKNRA